MWLFVTSLGLGYLAACVFSWKFAPSEAPMPGWVPLGLWSPPLMTVDLTLYLYKFWVTFNGSWDFPGYFSLFFFTFSFTVWTFIGGWWWCRPGMAHSFDIRVMLHTLDHILYPYYVSGSLIYFWVFVIFADGLENLCLSWPWLSWKLPHRIFMASIHLSSSLKSSIILNLRKWI